VIKKIFAYMEKNGRKNFSDVVNGLCVAALEKEEGNKID